MAQFFKEIGESRYPCKVIKMVLAVILAIEINKDVETILKSLGY